MADDLRELREARIKQAEKDRTSGYLCILVGNVENKIVVQGKMKMLRKSYNEYIQKMYDENAYFTIKGTVNGIPFRDTYRVSEIVGIRFVEGDICEEE